MRAFYSISMLLFWHTSLCAQQVGDRVIVTAEQGAPIKVENKIGGTASYGTIQFVIKINGEWLWVHAFDNPNIKGWINKRDITTLDKAEAFFTKQIQRNPNAFNYAARGHIRIEFKHYDLAIEDCTAAIRLDPNNALAYGDRGWAWHQKEEYEKAIADYGEMIRLRPEFSRVYTARAVLWDNKGETDRAIADFSQSLRLEPDNFTAYFYRGRLYQRVGKYKESEADLSNAIRLNPGIAAMYYSRGLTWRGLKKPDLAIKDFNEAIRLDSKDVDAHNALAWVYATFPEDQHRNGRKAVELSTKACELTQWKNWGCLTTLAAAHAENGDYPNAVKWEEKAIEIAPDGEKDRLRSRLELYKSSRPYREETKS